MRRTLLALTAVAVALMVGTVDANAQNMTVVQLTANYTPVGTLPAGQHYKGDNAVPGTMVIRLRARDPGGYILLNSGGGETRYDFKFYDAEKYTGGSQGDVIRIWYQADKDTYVACTLARREANRFSGLCRDQAGRDGWLEVLGRGGKPINPGEWPGTGG